jgi:hypothetical protein
MRRACERIRVARGVPALTSIFRVRHVVPSGAGRGLLLRIWPCLAARPSRRPGEIPLARGASSGVRVQARTGA